MFGWLWNLIKGFFVYIFVPPFVLAGFALVGILLVEGAFRSKIHAGALISGGAVVFTFINVALPQLENELMKIFILLSVVLFLALVDCIDDFISTAKYKVNLYKSDNPLSTAKKYLCGMVPGVTSLVFYYSTPSGQGRFENIFAHYGLLLFLLIAPRALFFIGEIYAKAKIYPEASKLIYRGDFFIYPSDVYFRRYLERWQGVLLSNESTIKEEKRISSEKLEKMYPKKFLAKAAEFFVGDKETIDKRERAEKEIAVMEEKVSYITKEGFQKFSAKAEEFLRQVSSMSPRDFIEMKFPQYKQSPPGVEFFLIEAFDSGVKTGKIVDESKDDYPMENHAYRHTESSVQVVSRNGNKELALDDDD